MAVYPYRNESLIQMETYHTDPPRADDLINAVRAKWAVLREQRFAGDYPVELLRSADGNGAIKIVEIFKWNSGQAKADVLRSRDYEQCARTSPASPPTPRPWGVHGRGPWVQHELPADWRRRAAEGRVLVPALGGRDRQGLPDEREERDRADASQPARRSGRRRPQRDVPQDPDARRRDSTRPRSARCASSRTSSARTTASSSRTEPATTISRRRRSGACRGSIQTALGPVLTDPDTPLVFGPARVQHYPPVGHALPLADGTGQARPRADRQAGRHARPGRVDGVRHRHLEGRRDLCRPPQRGAGRDLHAAREQPASAGPAAGAGGCGGNAVRSRTYAAGPVAARPAAVSMAR